MLNHFWQKMPAFQGATKPKPIARHDPNVFHPAAVCRGKIAETTDLGLVDEFKMVSGFARKPVKITMSGPYILAKVAYDEHYGDIAAMMADLGKLLRYNFRRLAEIETGEQVAERPIALPPRHPETLRPSGPDLL